MTKIQIKKAPEDFIDFANNYTFKQRKIRAFVAKNIRHECTNKIGGIIQKLSGLKQKTSESNSEVLFFRYI